MPLNSKGCDVCSMSAPFDRRLDATPVIACRRDGPEFLRQCLVCGDYWLETQRYEKWITREEAAKNFGGEPF